MDSGVYPASAVERAMKVQEAILRAIDGRLKWYQAAEVLGCQRSCNTPYLWSLKIPYLLA